MDREPEPRADRPYTYRVTFISLGIGIAVLLAVDFILLALRQPLGTDAKGGMVWSFGALALPAAGLISILIMGWSIFVLPPVFSRRQGILLDTEVWPATGTITLGVLVAVVFLGAILLGII